MREGRMKRNLENERCIYQMLPKPVERKMVQFVSKKGEKKIVSFLSKNTRYVIRSRSGRFLK